MASITNDIYVESFEKEDNRLLKEMKVWFSKLFYRKEDAVALPYEVLYSTASFHHLATTSSAFIKTFLTRHNVEWQLTPGFWDQHIFAR